MTTEQTALQRLKEVCEAENGRDPDILCYSPEYLEVASTALPALIELCEAQGEFIDSMLSTENIELRLGKADIARIKIAESRARLEEVCPKK